MDGERTAAVVMFMAICAFSAMVLMAKFRPSFTIDKTHYIQVGVMEINDNGNKVYTPVFKRIN